MVYKFFDKKFSDSGIKNEIKQNEPLGEELHRPISSSILGVTNTHILKVFLYPPNPPTACPQDHFSPLRQTNKKSLTPQAVKNAWDIFIGLLVL